MSTELYFRLVVLTAGTLLYLFLAMLLYRRRGRLERLLFALAISLFLFYAGRLLERNLELHFGPGRPLETWLFAVSLILLGELAFPPLLVHAHAEYRQVLSGERWPAWLKILVALFYVFSVCFGVVSVQLLRSGPADKSAGITWLPQLQLGWLIAALVFAGALEFLFARVQAQPARRLHLAMAAFFVGVAVLLLLPDGPELGSAMRRIARQPLWFWRLVPGAVLAYVIVRRNFLRLGEQRHLVYTVSAGFLALLYLTVALRISSWLDDLLPPVATLSILLFVLVVLFEPLQRRVGRWLERSFRRHVDRNLRLSAEFQNEARHGDPRRLADFAAARIRDEFRLGDVHIHLSGEEAVAPVVRPRSFPLRLGGGDAGALVVSQERGSLSAETSAALEHLAEQLPAAVDLCRLIEEKVRLERELAERERLALLGQMAARISHNLKNPLGSMKTLLQVLVEDPGLHEAARRDCQMVVAELDRLNAKLGQLLRYARPAVRPGAPAQRVGALAVAEQVVALLRREAERRQVTLELERTTDETCVAGPEEALNDVLTNLVVNAIEAVPAGGAVRVRLARRDAAVRIEVEDDGPGIPPEVRPRVFQPFVSTKPGGTGLGLAIVERRLAELDGRITWESPVGGARGTRFTITLPLAEDSERAAKEGNHADDPDRG